MEIFFVVFFPMICAYGLGIVSGKLLFGQPKIEKPASEEKPDKTVEHVADHLAGVFIESYLETMERVRNQGPAPEVPRCAICLQELFEDEIDYCDCCGGI